MSEDRAVIFGTIAFVIIGFMFVYYSVSVLSDRVTELKNKVRHAKEDALKARAVGKTSHDGWIEYAKTINGKLNEVDCRIEKIKKKIKQQKRWGKW